MFLTLCLAPYCCLSFCFDFKYVFLIFQLQLAYNVILVSDVQPKDQTEYNLLRNHPDKSSAHLTSYIVVTMLWTMFPYCILHPCDCSLTDNLYFTFFIHSPQPCSHLATTKMFSVSLSLCSAYSFILFCRLCLSGISIVTPGFVCLHFYEKPFSIL